MTEDEFNAIAWRDFILWAWNNPACRAQFERATGRIDTSANNDKLESFVEWITATHWGIEYAPRAYRERLEAKQGVVP